MIHSAPIMVSRHLNETKLRAVNQLKSSLQKPPTVKKVIVIFIAGFVVLLIIYFANIHQSNHQNVRSIKRWNKRTFFALPKHTEHNPTQTERMAVIHDHKFQPSYDWIRFSYKNVANSTSRNISESLDWLRWIVKNYDNLPERTVFLHGHKRSWHTPRNFIKQLNKAKPERVQMLGKHIWKKHGYYGQSELVGLNQVYQILFSRSFLEVAEATRLWTKKCCAEMVVSREAIRQHPRSIYRALVDLITIDPKQPWAWIFERSWENMFS